MRLVPLFAVATLLSSCCPQSECKTYADTHQFDHCVYDSLHPSRPTNLEHKNKPYIAFGDSIVAGGWCSDTCGFVTPLEELTGTQIANFGIAGYTAMAEVNPTETDPNRKFVRVRESVAKNPGASRVYLHIGGNDLQYYVRANMLLAPAPPSCGFAPQLQTKMAETIGYVRQIVLKYQELGVQQVVVGSLHPLEIQQDAPYAGSCFNILQDACNGRPECARAHECLNVLLEAYSNQLQAAVAGMPNVVFADHFHGFPTDEPGCCSISCDCAHLNCYGHRLMAEIWHNALP